MDLDHYDLDSLVYMSSNIVVATLSGSVDGKAKDAGPPVLTVTENWQGSIQPGTKIGGMGSYLTFFDPMETGQTMVIFLAAPVKDSMFPDVNAAPYSIAPSGIYLIDKDRHVHEYYQHDNPGPYVAESSEEEPDEDDGTPAVPVKLPTVEETHDKVLASLKYVALLKPLIDKTPITSADLPALRKSLEERKSGTMGGFFGSDIIAEKITADIFAAGDPDAILESYDLMENWRSGGEFIAPPQTGEGNGSRSRDLQFEKTRVAFLVQTLGDKGKSLTERRAAAKILVSLCGFQTEGDNQVDLVAPEHNDPTKDFADQIVAEAGQIFEDKAEDTKLRELCLALMGTHRPHTFDAATAVYHATDLPDLKYTIEVAFLKLGDKAYEGLHPQDVLVASIVRPADPRGQCGHAAADKLALEIDYNETTKYKHDYFAMVKRQNEAEEAANSSYAVLVNMQSGEQTRPKVQQCWAGGDGGANMVVLDRATTLPVGKYQIYYQYEKDGKPVSHGYALPLTVTQTANGSILSSN